MNVLALCAGIGGLEYGVRHQVPGARTVCYVERDSFAASVLVGRMEDQTLESAPIWDDLESFDGRAWRGRVDCITAGFPCQDISVAGLRAGLSGKRSGLWWQVLRIVREVEPEYVFVENVGRLVLAGLDGVLAGLAESGFDAEWGVFRASDVGAPHRRERIFILAKRVSDAERDAVRDQPERGAGSARQADQGDAEIDDMGGEALADTQHAGLRAERPSLHEDRGDAPGDDAHRCDEELAEPGLQGLEGSELRRIAEEEGLDEEGELRLRAWAAAAQRGGSFPPGPSDLVGWAGWLAGGGPAPALPAVRGKIDGVPFAMDRLRVLGNAVVPVQASFAWSVLSERLEE